MRELFILRHGKSDWSVAVGDFDRPLKNRGVRAARRVGDWLAREGLQPDLILTSPAERAVATASEVCAAMGLEVDMRRDDRVYHASAELLLEVLRSLDDGAQRVMLVGHNPGLADLVELLAAAPIAEPEDGKLLPTAALARFRIETAWADLAVGSGILVALHRPRELPQS